MYTMTGSVPVAPRGLMDAHPHVSDLGGMRRASAGVMSYKNGGLENASATCCAAGSRTIGLAAVMTVLLTRSRHMAWAMSARRCR
jgi:hypothetical protein